MKKQKGLHSPHLLRILFLFVLLQLFSICMYAKNPVQIPQTDKQKFVENKGQWDKEVLYMTQIGGLNAWITRRGIVYDFYKIKNENISDARNMDTLLNDTYEKQIPKEKYGQIVNMELLKANANAEVEGYDKCSCYYNYMIGNDKSKWASNAGLYKEVKLEVSIMELMCGIILIMEVYVMTI